jgi:drug/metabolite transporter (DMT)-like permease
LGRIVFEKPLEGSAVPLTALLLLIIAGVLHAGWNLLVKRAGEKYIFTWWAWAVGSFAGAPLLALSPALPRTVWLNVLISALAQAAYFVALARAYTIGDFSLVYPLARGAAPALLVLWAVLFLGERPGWGGLLGLGLLLSGLLMVGGLFMRPAAVNPADVSRRLPFSASAIGAALSVALCISIYTVFDGAAVQIASPMSYTLVEFLGATALITPIVLRRYSANIIMAEWRANWPRIIAVGGLLVLTYWLVLLAYSAGHIAYAGAIREISVVFAALLGWRWLGEGFGLARFSGALLIFAGILTIAVMG